MNDKYKTFEELKEEFGEDYEHKFYEMGLSAVKENERLIEELQRKDNIINDLKSSIADYQEAVGDYQDEIVRKDNIIKDIKEELIDDNKFELFYADDNIGSVMTLGAKYYREYLLDIIKDIENGNK